jgi:hypothetical protein
MESRSRTFLVKKPMANIYLLNLKKFFLNWQKLNEKMKKFKFPATERKIKENFSNFTKLQI